MMTSRSTTPSMGFVNRWSGVQFSHPAPLVLLSNPRAPGIFEASANPESTESTESNVVLPYRKSGHSDRSGHPIDQRSGIGTSAGRRAQKGQHHGPAERSASRPWWSQKWSHDSAAILLLLALTACSRAPACTSKQLFDANARPVACQAQVIDLDPNGNKATRERGR